MIPSGWGALGALLAVLLLTLTLVVTQPHWQRVLDKHNVTTSRRVWWALVGGIVAMAVLVFPHTPFPYWIGVVLGYILGIGTALLHRDTVVFSRSTEGVEKL